MAMVDPRSNGLVHLKSSVTVSETVERLERVLQERGIRIFAHIDHAAAAAEEDLEMRPTQVLILGNPVLGTPMMVASPTLAIDLPFRVLVWEDRSRQVWVTYNAPEYLVSRHGVSALQSGNLNGLVKIIRETVAGSREH